MSGTGWVLVVVGLSVVALRLVLLRRRSAERGHTRPPWYVTVPVLVLAVGLLWWTEFSGR